MGGWVISASIPLAACRVHVLGPRRQIACAGAQAERKRLAASAHSAGSTAESESMWSDVDWDEDARVLRAIALVSD